MGIYNKAFSLFNKSVGAAQGFALNHVFPVMKTDYMALKAGYTGMSRAFAGGMPTGFANRARFMGGAFARGGSAVMGAYRGMGISPGMAGLRLGGYAAGGGIGMWGISRVGRKEENTRPPYGIY